MDIEDDFIEDSEEEQEPESETKDESLFIAEINSKVPTELKPAVNVLPITKISRTVISAVQSLMLFGTSEIGASVPGSIYDLGAHLKRSTTQFPGFVSETGLRAHSEEYKLGLRLDKIEQKVDRAQQFNRQLKTHIRKINVSMNRAEQSRTNRGPIGASDGKATGMNLRRTIEKLREVHGVVAELRSENDELKEVLAKVMKKFRRKVKDENMDKRNSVVRTEVGLMNDIVEHKRKVEEGEAIVAKMGPEIAMIEQRLADLERRLAGSRRKVPLRRPPGAQAPMMKGAQIPRVAFASRYR